MQVKAYEAAYSRRLLMKRISGNADQRVPADNAADHAIQGYPGIPRETGGQTRVVPDLYPTKIKGNSRARWWWAITTTRLTRVWPVVVLIADIVISAVVATLAGLAAAVVGLGIYLGLHDQHGRPTWLAVGFLLAYMVAATVALLVWATRASKRWDR